MKKFSIYYNLIRYGYRNKYTRSHGRYKRFPFSRANDSKLREFLSGTPSRDAVVFVGLKQVRNSIGVENPYEYLRDLLEEKFETLIVPTYTPSVLTTGIFDVRTTPSETGSFSQQFLQQSGKRTMSPLKSFALLGPRENDIMSLQTFNDYSADGIFEYFYSNAITSINIGTVNPRFSTIHYCEYTADLPYLLKEKPKIRVMDHEGNEALNEYFYLGYKQRLKFNRDKIEKHLMKAGSLEKLVINDLIVRIINERKAFDLMLGNLKRDPYYLVD